MKQAAGHKKSTMNDQKTEFEKSGEQKPPTLVQEFVVFMIEHSAWWLMPLLIALGLLSLFAVLGSTGAAPFIYTLH